MTDAAALAVQLNALLGPTLVGALTGDGDQHGTEAWADRGAAPTSHQIERMARALDAFQRISAAEGDDVARAWFIGGSPVLGEVTPITAIREDRFDALDEAVRALIDDDGAFR